MPDTHQKPLALRPYARWVVNHRSIVAFVMLVATVFLGSRLGSLQVDSNPDLWAPQEHPYVKATNLIEKVFGGRNYTIIGITPKSGDIYQPSVLAKVKKIQDEVELIPHAVKHNVLSLAARKVKQITGGPEGMVVRPMMETIPQTPAEMEKLKAAVASMPIYQNALVSPDGRSVAIIADFKQDSTVPNFAMMNTRLRAIVDSVKDESVDIYLGGLPLIGEAADRQFMRMPLYFGGALLVIMLIQFWSFRSLQGMFLPMATGIMSVIWSLGLMGLLGVHIDPLNTTTPILILAVAAGHAIQILKRYYEEYSVRLNAGDDPKTANREAVVESIARVGPVMIVAGLIAALTFLSLGSSGISMIQHFGIFAGFGVISTMLIEMTIIPVVRASLRPPKAIEVKREGNQGFLDRMLSGLATQLAGGRAKTIVAAGLTVLAIVGIGVAKLRVDNNFKLYHKPESELRVHDRALNAAFGGTSSIQFVIDANATDGIKDPKVLEAMDRLQTYLDHAQDVGKTQSLADVVKQMNKAMHADDKAFYRIPESRDLVAQYLFLYTLSGDPQDFDTFVDNDFRRASIWALLKNDGTANAEHIVQGAQDILASFPPGVTVQMGGSLPQLIALNNTIVADKAKNMVQMAIIVFILGAVVLRSVVGGLFVVTPLFAVMLANFGVMGWLGTPLDVSAMTTAAMAIGIGADYEIYLLFRFREELERTGSVLGATRNSMLTSGKAILLVAISVAAGYAVLQTSSFAFYNTLSNMVTATMVTSAFFALFFLRALMMIFKPRFVFGDRRDQYFPKQAAMAGGAQ